MENSTEHTICRQEMRRQARMSLKQDKKNKKQMEMYNTRIKVGIDKLKDKYEKSVSKIRKEFKLMDDLNCSDAEKTKEQTVEEYIAIALLEAERIWLNIQIMVLEHFEEFKKSSDEDKISLLRKDFKEFYDEFPIVSRYMICMGQYRQKAFHKFLLECQKHLSNIPADREEGYMQDQWIRRQADYVRFLWEEMQDVKLTKTQLKESDSVWQKTYDALTNEFNQFKDMYKNTEEKVKQDDAKFKLQLVNEIGKRIINNEQKLDNNDTKKLLETLRVKVYKQRYDNVIKQINSDIIKLESSVVGIGTNEQAQEEYEYEMKQLEYKKKYKKIM